MPGLAVLCVFAVLAPEAGSGEKEFLVDALEDLSRDSLKPLVALSIAPGFKRDGLRLPGLYHRRADQLDHPDSDRRARDVRYP